MGRVTGIHHVTAIAGDPQRNAGFYAGVLGLRLVKKTVNFDDPTTYHLYYGDAGGKPGTIMTFFPWPDAPRGRIGSGQVVATAFSVPAGSLGYWTERLVESGVRFERPRERFGETILSFADVDGLRVELAATEDRRRGWDGGPVPTRHSVRGLHHVTLAVEVAERTVRLLTETLGFRRVAAAEGRERFAAGEGGPGGFVDVSETGGFPAGSTGVGTVHHVAFRVPDEEVQLALREEVAALGYNVTPVIDRKYFRSVYFREPGGVLFELATDGPGFTADEVEAELGRRLQLPPWLERRREEIERSLPPVSVPAGEPA
ncbi:Putative ring-cleaving dioxygenase MhqO [Rubrobacter xylanophilus DSM 9941]|uniref:ring-cleaving dioxygenase n=1 Tax=Rubrobacter xylanophilus TaxID=49319 RepID=UPI001C63DBBB|nr:ring-cleaving dioxygenase [Rubrobacter xylanophilus]QYJ14295.1 Putative ring-cleaving dioxygenase MhqO [Rubrobacter xylanophilus DSM 9941]